MPTGIRISICVRSYNSSNGVILSPGWPTFQKDVSVCAWEIKSTADKFIVLNFMELLNDSTIEISGKIPIFFSVSLPLSLDRFPLKIDPFFLL